MDFANEAARLHTGAEILVVFEFGSSKSLKCKLLNTGEDWIHVSDYHGKELLINTAKVVSIQREQPPKA